MAPDIDALKGGGGLGQIYGGKVLHKLQVMMTRCNIRALDIACLWMSTAREW